MKRLVSLAASLILGLAGVAVSTPAQAATDTLPDLKMRPPSGFYIENTPNERRLRFTTIIYNAGDGRFEVQMSRPDTATATMTVRQRVWQVEGTSRYVDVPNAYGFYAGDGHNHWHLNNLQEFTIRAYNSDGTTSPTISGKGAKTGFCFFDNTKVNLTLRGAPASPYYTNCGVSSSLSVKEGLSVGWGDKYSATTTYQWIKINGLKDGKYRVQVIADPGNRFLEKTETNNTSSAYIQITGNTVTMLTV